MLYFSIIFAIVFVLTWYGLLAQLVEHQTLNLQVIGSIPMQPTIRKAKNMQGWRNW